MGKGRQKMDGWMDGSTDGFILERLNMWKVSVATGSHQSYCFKRTEALALSACNVQ